MRHQPVLVACAAALLGLLSACGNQPPPTPEVAPSVPIVARISHAGLTTAAGEPVAVTLEVIEATQRSMITRLEEVTDGPIAARDMIDAVVDDRILARALYVDALVARVEGSPVWLANMVQVNGALRRHYVTVIGGGAGATLGEPWLGGVSEPIARALEDQGIAVLSVTYSAGAAYVAECRAAGVPVPDKVLDPSIGWVNRGGFTTFISQGLEAELWSWQSDDPAREGVCLALPRWNAMNQAELLGVICLGTDASKACFFDNPNGTWYPRDTGLSIDQFVGGTDLTGNGQGTCSDCHAGENPFVIHPDEPAFASLRTDSIDLIPNEWYEPLVDASWPQNPGPIAALGSVSVGQLRCDTCHNQAVAGRFPFIWELGEYCGDVLGRASPLSGMAPTMPPAGFEGDYYDHSKLLDQLCGAGSPGTVIEKEGPADDAAFLSPPIVLPVYECAAAIGVRGTRLGATLTLLLDGSPVATLTVRNPDLEEFVLDDYSLPPADSTQSWTATQTYGGVDSIESDPVVPRSHLLDYPAGLPAPTIAPPTAYECGRTLAVGHVPGARIVIKRDGGGEAETRGSANGYTVAQTDAVFAEGDSLRARQILCSDESSNSIVVVAQPAPALAAPEIHLGSIYRSQELLPVTRLTEGAVTLVTSATGVAGYGHWPTTWRTVDVGHPLALDEAVELAQVLCEQKPADSPWITQPCSAIPAPRILPPFDGQRSVVLTESVPGAIIRVHDGSVEIADGSGGEIWLSRPLEYGETVRVMQQLGATCRAPRSYSVVVQ